MAAKMREQYFCIFIFQQLLIVTSLDKGTQPFVVCDG